MFKRLTGVLCLVLILLAGTTVAQAALPPPGTLFASTGTNNELIILDPGTGAATAIVGSTAGFGPVTEIECRPDGVLFGSTGGGNSSIITIDILTGAATPVGVHEFGAVNGLEFSPDGTTLYGTYIPIPGEPSQLVTVDQATGALTPIGPTGFNNIGGLAFGPDNVLYGVTSGAGGGNLVSIDPATGAATLIGPTGFIDVAALEFGPDNLLYGGLGGGDGGEPSHGNLIVIDPATGAGTIVGYSGFSVISGLAFFPGPRGPRVAVNPTKVNFGSIYTGQVGHGEVHIVNVGDAPLSVSAISQLQGEQSSFFDIFFEASLPTWLQPGEELVVQTDFTPQDQTFYQSFFDVFTNDPDDPAVRVTLCGNGVFPPTTLHFEEAFARPGGHAVVDVAVESNQSIAGLQFKIQPYCNGNPSWYVHFNGLINDLEGDGWTASFATDPNGVTTVLFFHTGGGALPPYQHHRILELVFDIDPNIPFGKWIDLVTWDVVLSDPNSQPIPFNLWQGTIHIGHPGDIAGGQLGGGDGHPDILDLIKLVKKLIGLLPQPEWGSFEFFLCDVNGDGYINILDLVALINDILNEQGTKVIVDGPTRPVTVSLGDVQTLTGTQLAVPVTLTANGSVAGMQATFTFDAAHLQLGTPQLVGAAAGMTLQSQIVDGTLRVLLYSATGQVIPAGSGSLLAIPATLVGDGAPELTLADVLLADRGAQAIPVVMGTSTVKVAPLPTVFALKGARPNPFNPTTRLAYEVPKQAHIVLAVYNLLGQEVLRLVDAEQQPGRYEVVWSGRNAQGLSVASGVYLYRLTSSSGFSETKRMTLLK